MEESRAFLIALRESKRLRARARVKNYAFSVRVKCFFSAATRVFCYTRRDVIASYAVIPPKIAFTLDVYFAFTFYLDREKENGKMLLEIYLSRIEKIP